MAPRPAPVFLVLLAVALLGPPAPGLAGPALALAAPAAENTTNEASTASAKSDGAAPSSTPPSTPSSTPSSTPPSTPSSSSSPPFPAAATPSGHPEDGSGLAVVQRSCAARYTLTCLKLDALSVLSRMAVPASYDLLPGVTIHRQEQRPAPAGAASPPQSGLPALPADLMRSLAVELPAGRADRRLDEYLMARFGSFLDSHTVQVHLLDLQPVASLRRALQGGGEADATGRRRPQGGMWQQLMGAGMMMGGSTLTMGLSALAAMAGKALMLSMLSLVLSALSGMHGGGGGGHSQKQTTYEIISKPIYTHGHSHSAELHHEPSGPAGYGLYGRAKDAAEGALAGVSAGTAASGVGGSAIGAPPGSAYITQFPRSLQESAAQVPHSSKKSEEEKAASAASPAAPAANYDSLLIRNLQYVKGPDGRAKYAIATPVAAAAASADLVPSETDYHAAAGGDESAGAARKYTAVASAARAHNNAHAAASHDDPAARSFQLSAAEEDEDGLTGVAGLGLYETAGGGVLAGPRSMHTLSRLPQLLVGPQSAQGGQAAYRRPYEEALSRPAFREPLPSEMLSLSSPGSAPWEGVTTAPPPATSTAAGHAVNPAFVVAKAVSPASREDQPASAAPRPVAYHTFS